MSGAPEPLGDEIARLRRCLNDLVGITALPALWAGAQPQRVVGTLLDALREMLRLAFAYVRLAGDLDGDAGLEMARVAAPVAPTTSPQEIGATLAGRLGADPAAWAATARVSIGDAALHVAVVRLGLHGEFGTLVAGSGRPDFPAQAEWLLLDVGANQAAVGLQQARLLADQRRLSETLDERVARGTGELAATNEALRHEAAERARAQESLHSVANNLARFLDTFPGYVVTTSPAGRVEHLNAEVLRYFGKTPDDLRDWSLTDAVPPDELPWVIETVGRHFAAGTPYTIEHRCRRADGVYRWFQIRSHPVRDAEGVVTGWYVLLTDIDDLKRAEGAIRASERDLKLITDTIPALAWSAGADGAADFFNQHYLNFIGLTAEEASGSGWTAAVHPDDLPGVATTWQRVWASREPGEAEARLRRHDGAYRWFLIRANPLVDESGRVVRWYGINTDIEDRKQAEDALRRSEASLLEVQRLSRTGGWRYDVATDVIESSREIQRAYAVQPGDDVTHPPFWFDRIHPEERARVRAEFERCVREQADYQAGYRIVLPDGTVRYQYATGHPVVDDRGALAGFVGASMDMTEQWRANRELERASDALRELQAEMSRAAQVATAGELAASIAHEVNQPLSGIITNASTCLRMLGADPPNVDGARETARRALRDGGRAAAVIERLRALFGKKEFALESLDLNEATREVVALSSGDLQRSRVVLELELADDLPMVMGDRVQLQQVVLNLLRNAADAMADVDGRPREVRVRTERAPDDLVRVTVRDTGAGVDPRAADRIFDAFHTTKRGGMGVGLSVSRSIVQRHHGRLWVEPNAGPGAAFVFTIPAGAERRAGRAT